MADSPYKTFPLPMASRGLAAYFAVDKVPDGMFLNLDGWEQRDENAMSTVLGTARVTTTPLGAAVHTLSRLKSIGQNYRYAFAADKMFRRTGDVYGDYTQVASGLSGSRCSVIEARPDFSSSPYVLIADKTRMLKDNGTFAAAQKLGIDPPTSPPVTALLDTFYKIIDICTGPSTFTFSNATGAAQTLVAATTLTVNLNPGIQWITPASMAGITPGTMFELYGPASVRYEIVNVLQVSDTQFYANVTSAKLAGDTCVAAGLNCGVAASTTGTITKTGPFNLGLLTAGANQVPTQDDDQVHIAIAISAPQNIKEIRLIVDVGDGSFNTDYYWKAIAPGTDVAATAGGSTASAAVTARAFTNSIGATPTNARAAMSLDGTLDNSPDNPQWSGGLGSFELRSGTNAWQHFFIRVGDFAKAGSAGAPGHDLTNCAAVRISVQTTDAGSVSFSFDDIYIVGGSGPDSTGGTAYDYRRTNYNKLTDGESSPSPTQVAANALLAFRQPITLDWSADPPVDSQITHTRLYRRGGSLPSNWLLVAEVPVGTNNWTDNIADRFIQENKILELDNDAPVTSTMQVPVDTTTTAAIINVNQFTAVTPTSMVGIVPGQWVLIGDKLTAPQAAQWQDQLDNEEWVLVHSTTSTTFTAWFQKTHLSGARVQAVSVPSQAMNLAALALNRVFIAGDVNNPSRLYYSKLGRYESFPPQNWIDVGPPTDPIVAVTGEMNGRVVVKTLSKRYDIVAPGNTPPFPMPTNAVKHGLWGSFAWAVYEGAVWYLSNDGIYVSSGGPEAVMTQAIKWLFTGIADGPLFPLDATQLSDVIFANSANEIFVAYTDTNAQRRRLIWEGIQKRWRPDPLAATAMYYEKDTGLLMVGMADGHVYQDRVGSSYNSAPIAVNLQTPAHDLGLGSLGESYSRMGFIGGIDIPKVFNEATLDIDTQGQNMAATLLFDNLQTPLALGNVNTTGRKKVQLNINAGNGQESYNVSLKLTGNVTQRVTLWSAKIRAAIEAEWRKSFDSYWLRYGVDEWKIAKEAWIEYVAPDAAGVAVSVYVNGDMSAPEFTFTMPQATKRSVFKKRFPPTKFTQIRYVMTSLSDFRVYDDSTVDINFVGANKGYKREKLVSQPQ